MTKKAILITVFAIAAVLSIFAKDSEVVQCVMTSILIIGIFLAIFLRPDLGQKKPINAAAPTPPPKKQPVTITSTKLQLIKEINLVGGTVKPYNDNSGSTTSPAHERTSYYVTVTDIYSDGRTNVRARYDAASEENGNVVFTKLIEGKSYPTQKQTLKEETITRS